MFKTQSWSKFEKANPGFLFQTSTNNHMTIRDALMSMEPCSIRVFIIDIRPAQEFQKHTVTHTNTFVVIGDASGTAYLVTTDLTPNTLKIDQTYDLTQVRRKMFNGVPILSTTINSHISPSLTVNKHTCLLT